MPVLDSIVVSIPACHAGDQGSIPCRGELLRGHTEKRKGGHVEAEINIQNGSKVLGQCGVEPTTFALLARRSNRLS